MNKAMLAVKIDGDLALMKIDAVNEDHVKKTLVFATLIREIIFIVLR